MRLVEHIITHGVPTRTTNAVHSNSSMRRRSSLLRSSENHPIRQGNDPCSSACEKEQKFFHATRQIQSMTEQRSYCCSPATDSNHRTTVATFLTALSVAPSLRSGRNRASSDTLGIVRKQISICDFKLGEAVSDLREGFEASVATSTSVVRFPHPR